MDINVIPSIRNIPSHSLCVLQVSNFTPSTVIRIKLLTWFGRTFWEFIFLFPGLCTLKKENIETFFSLLLPLRRLGINFFIMNLIVIGKLYNNWNEKLKMTR